MESKDVLLCRVDAALKNHPHLRTIPIRSDENSGRVILSGHVSSYYLAQMAQEAVRGIDGVMEIENRVQVVWPG